MKDRFSGHANQYAAFRPKYPAELFELIYKHVRSFNQAWDAGTGNGQAAAILAKRFKNVLGTDISQNQLDQAEHCSNVSYAISGETCLLKDHCANLITVAQAIHWFDRQRFYAEAARVAAPKAVIAVWVYGLLKISPEIDPIMEHFYTKIVGPFWDPERRIIDEKLETIDFPFDEVKAPGLSMKFEWTLTELEGYLNTWSATRKYIQQNGGNPVEELISRIAEIHHREKLQVDFPLYLRMGTL